MDLEYWKNEIHGLAREKGWWKGKRDVAEIANNLHAELSEAWEEYRASGTDDDLGKIRFGEDGKPEGFAVEVADFVIRLLDACGGWDIALENDLGPHYRDFYMESLPLVEAILGMHRMTGAAALYISIGERELCGDICFNSIYLARRLMNLVGADLEEVIRIKHGYNKTRPYRHGNKRA